jgi:hypothetical protein
LSKALVLEPARQGVTVNTVIQTEEIAFHSLSLPAGRGAYQRRRAFDRFRGERQLLIVGSWRLDRGAVCDMGPFYKPRRSGALRSVEVTEWLAERF